MISFEPSTYGIALHWGLVIGISLRVIMRQPPVGAALAWMTIVATTPFVGATIYLMFGERRIGRGRAARILADSGMLRDWQNQLGTHSAAVDAQLSVDALALSRHAAMARGYPVQGGNEITLLADENQVFDQLVRDIDAAQVSCQLAFYIWDEQGRISDVVDALIRAAGRGVTCQALADSIGSKDFLRSESAQRLRDAGVALSAAMPTGPIRALFVRRDLRNHRKIAVIDDTVAYTGSQNMVDPRFFKREAKVGQWVDAMVRITGPTAAALRAVFMQDWILEREEPWVLDTFSPPPADQAASGTFIQVVPSGPDQPRDGIDKLLLTAIYGAHKSVVMTTPYFVPDESILTALISAARRQVDVTLIVPARNDSIFVRFAGVANFDQLLNAGVKIARFEDGLLHTKSLIVDGEISLFGSVNLDMRSLWLNFEISLFVYNADFTARLIALHDDYLARSTLLDRETWEARPRWHRLAENTFRLLGPLL
ncbi:MAG: cardiolipin synthase [Synoicihabitans sp.]